MSNAKDLYRRSVRFQKDTSKEVIQFVNLQSNFSEVASFLFEMAYRKFGMKDISKYTAILKDENIFKELLSDIVIADIDTTAYKEQAASHTPIAAADEPDTQFDEEAIDDIPDCYK